MDFAAWENPALDVRVAQRMLSILAAPYTDDEGALELCAIWPDRTARKPPQARHCPPSAPDMTFLARQNDDGFGLYVGAALRRGAPADGRASREHVAFTRWIWIDVDDAEAAEVVLNRLALAGIAPTFSVITGRRPGIRRQCWWRLSAPLSWPEAGRLMERLIAATGADLNPKDPARVMRLAGSVSWPKPEKPGRVAELVMLEDGSEGTFTASHLAAAALRMMPEDPQQQTGSFRVDTGGQDRAPEAEVAELLSYINADLPYSDWLAVLMGLHDWDPGNTGRRLAEEWSARGAKYRPGEVAEKWASFQPGGGQTIATVAKLARDGGADLSEISLRRRGGTRSTDQKDGSQKALGAKHHEDKPRLFAPLSRLAGKPVPPRLWHVPEWVPSHTVTMLGGDGGTGKSLLAKQLAVSTVLGTPWLGQEVRQGRAMFLSAEDDADELHRRFGSIVEAEGASFAELSDLHTRSLAGDDALLAVLDRKTGALAPTDLFHQLDAEMGDIRPAFLGLDTLADLHSGDENNRTHARQVIGMLRGLAMRHGCAVLLLAQPSLTGMASGSGLSGSTAWNGSVRSRLYMDRIKEDGYEPDPDARRLARVKANYARTGSEISLRWADGVFIADAPASGLDRMAASAKAQRVFLKLLRQFSDEGRHVSANPGPTHAPSVFAKHPGAEGCTKRALSTAMDALFAAGKIRVADHGRAGRERKHIELCGGAE